MTEANRQATTKLRSLVKAVLGEFPSMSSKARESDEITRHFLNRLLVATDYASACAVLAEANLGSPLMPISRALFESFISTYWGAQSEANGKVIVEAAQREMKRILKLNLRNEWGKIVDKETDEDKTKEWLRDPKTNDAQRLPQYAHMAEGAGIRKIYDQMYGMLSLLSHASGADLLARRNQDEMINSALQAVSAELRCIHLIISARINEQRVVRLDEVEAIMKVALA